MSRRPPGSAKASRRAAHGNGVGGANLTAKVLIPKDLLITQAEIEVVAALLDDWPEILAGGGEEP